MLTEVASILAATMNQAHSIARFGDHDFMIFPTMKSRRWKWPNAACTTCATMRSKSIQNSPVKPVYSIGVTARPPGDQRS